MSDPKLNGEQNSKSFTFDKQFVYICVVVIFGMLGWGVKYMVNWNSDDLVWKATKDERDLAVFTRIANIELMIKIGVLPMAQRDIESNGRRITKIEEFHARNFPPSMIKRNTNEIN